MRSGRSHIFIAVVWATLCALVTPAWGDLAAAKGALAGRDFPTAIAQAGRVADTHPYDAAMIQARAHMELGQLDPALAAVGRAKMARPNDSAAYALEGLILLRMGRPGRAMLSLRRALDLAENDQQKSIARALIRQAKSAQKWQVQGGIGIVPSSNLNKATTAETITVLIPGTTTPVNAQLVGGQAESGTGLRLFGQATRTMGPWGLSFGGDITHTDDPSLRQHALQFGLTRTVGASRLGLTHQRRFVGGDAFVATTALRFDHQVALPEQSALRFTVGLAHQNRFDDPLRDGYITTAGVRWIKLLRPTLAWDMGVEVQNTASRSAFEASRAVTVDVGARGALAGTGWVWDGRLHLGVGRWDDVAPFEPLARRDRQVGLSFSAQNNNVSFYGLTPTYGISAQRRKSNLGRHDIRSVDLFIGLANAF